MSERATAALVGAFEECDEAWREQFDRRPRARELVHAFEICLVSAAEDLVSDVDDCIAMMFPETPHREPEERRRIRPMDLDVTFRMRTDRWEPDTGTVALRESGVAVAELMLDMAETTLVVDYTNRGGLTISELRAVMKAKVASRYAAHHKLEIARVLLRPLEGIDDPVEVDLYEA